MRKKVVLQLQGLNCANCAQKIQKKIEKFEMIHMATIDFANQKLIYELNDESEEFDVLLKVKSVIKAIEPDVVVQQYSQSYSQIKSNNMGIKSQKRTIVRLIIGALFLVTTIFSPIADTLKFVFYLASYLIIGGNVLYRAVRNIIRGQVFDENFLMSLATIGAFFIGEYVEGIAVMLFYEVGELFQDYAVNRSRKSITDAMDIRPEYANLKVGNEYKQVSPLEVKANDTILVKPGERIPLDSKVIDGNSSLDTSALTGESMPREVKKDDLVLSGSININGLLTLQVTKEYTESTVAKILNLVENVSEKKANTENFITKFARIYTPVVVFCAVALAIVPTLFGASFSDQLYQALVFLVLSCPCALVLSVPLSFFAGIGGSAKNGILVKGGNYIEALARVDTVVFDKTGTLTKGTFMVKKINPVNLSSDELLELAAYAEGNSNHPIAQSIIKSYGKPIDSSKISTFYELPGQGIKAVIDGKTVLVGNDTLMKSQNIVFDETNPVGTIMYIAIDGKYEGYMIIADEIKGDAKLAIGLLKKMGIHKTVMLTGDSQKVGNAVANELGLDEVYTELLPSDKVEKVEELLNDMPKKSTLAFVGDGINDAPVLARADVGIAMGGVGSDAAVEAADIVIMTDEPSKIPIAIAISRKTLKIVKQNIVFILGVKVIVLILGVFGVATMWEAVFADVGVSLLAVLNAVRALSLKKS